MRKSIAAAVTVAIALLVATPAGAAPEPPVPLMPGTSFAVAALFTDDAVFAIADDAGGSGATMVLFTRSLTEDDTSVTLGPATRVARMSWSAIAEHDGTLAYQRNVDGRLVLRAPDGTETLPAWGADPNLVTYGPDSMSSTWLASGGTIYNRATGAQYDLLDLVTDLPSGMVSVDAGLAHLDDGRVLWAVHATDQNPDNPQFYRGIYTVALGATGPEGPTTRLDTSDSGGTFTTLGFIGPWLVWSVRGNEQLTVRFVPVDSLGSVPSERVFASDPSTFLWAHNAGESVAVTSSGYACDDGSAVWFDPADPDTDLYTYTLPDGGCPLGTSGTLLAYGYWSGDNDAWVVDVAGRTVTADASLPVPPATFPDVSAGNPFFAEISWLTDLGITRGYADGTFRPAGTVSREAIAAFLYRLAGEPDFTAPATSPFQDVATTHPFYKEISWLADTGISTGTTTPTGAYYKPANPVSREAMAAFLHRMHTGGHTIPWGAVG